MEYTQFPNTVYAFTWDTRLMRKANRTNENQIGNVLLNVTLMRMSLSIVAVENQ